MRPFWIVLALLMVQLVAIWGAYALFGRAHTVPHELPVPSAVHQERAPDALEVTVPDSHRNNRKEVLTARGVFPCSQCHNLLIPNPVRREKLATPHERIHLEHGEVTWCYNCHDKEKMDSLVLLDGTNVGFNESHRLCGQCHGPIYKDWRYGAHGQRTGDWNGQKDSWLCVRCHHPHDPKFKPMRPLPPPRTRFQTGR